MLLLGHDVLRVVFAFWGGGFFCLVLCRAPYSLGGSLEVDPKSFLGIPAWLCRWFAILLGGWFSVESLGRRLVSRCSKILLCKLGFLCRSACSEPCLIREIERRK